MFFGFTCPLIVTVFRITNEGNRDVKKKKIGKWFNEPKLAKVVAYLHFKVVRIPL